MIDYLNKFDRRLWALAIGWVASAMGFALAFPYLALYFHSELNISMYNIGLYFGVAAIIRSLSQALGGEISDKLGRYYPMVIAQILRSATFIVVALAIFNNWGFFAVGGLIILNSIFGAVFQPAANATVADLVDIKLRSEGYAIVRVAGNLGWSIGPMLGGLFADKSYALLFIISAGMTLTSSIIIATSLRGVKYKRASEEGFKIKDIFKIKGNELLFKYIAFVLILYLVVSQFMAPFSLYTVDFMELTKKQLGLLYGLNGLIVILFQIHTTRLIRKFRLTTQMLLGALIYGIGYFWCGLAWTFWGFTLVIVIITIGENCVSPAALSITANLAPIGKTGRYMGIYGLAVTMGWSMGPLLGGTLLEFFNPDFIYGWSVVAILALIASAGFIWLGSQIPQYANYSKKA